MAVALAIAQAKRDAKYTKERSYWLSEGLGNDSMWDKGYGWESEED
ncbi:hypothetical protein IG631_14107 [Alternaria alternata]|jgi:hypothetical protein|nr:hypothetical protein IG631_14107 [Alternaria alternata]